MEIGGALRFSIPHDPIAAVLKLAKLALDDRPQCCSGADVIFEHMMIGIGGHAFNIFSVSVVDITIYPNAFDG